ncbi:MarR family winged helix-turn-helix transcriptional regulator [Actinomadura parmotrematis]|uniref:MarR family winged helix-turn-helix transcriptional regulator n=1 Tax=Actinomadura parmotrematis TaxID=2864039 RepID=A0ABS7G4C2_9ACTN|nr:MarR family winged helix-turn-helix transcriptional regulator [Actinomadura parmotrematis]MBW8487581.1 MarR family winged helix-turn-helix transcriptional regulator [Actinomadura parmotrematis]
MTGERAQIIEELRAAAQRGTMFTVLLHHATATKAGLNVTDAQCINALTLDGPQTPGRLAQLMGITTGGAITAVVDRLEKAGYVRRSRDPDDRRRVIIELVPEAVARFSDYFEPIARSFAGLVADYDDDRLRLLLEWMRASNARMPGVIEQVRDLP